MERLTKHSKQTSHENGICCTHFRGPECLEVGGNCAMNCKWEEAAWSRLAAYEDKELEPEEVLPKDKADEIALKLMCLADLESLCSYTRLRELAEADENGRLVVIPRQKNEEERLERRRLMRIMADGAIHRLMENPLKEKNGPDIAELRNEVPYAEWLEKSLQAIVPLKPVCLCFAATMPDGEVYTGYYNADATDKAVIAHNIQADITMDIIRTNAAIIKDMIEHCEEDE